MFRRYAEGIQRTAIFLFGSGNLDNTASADNVVGKLPEKFADLFIFRLEYDSFRGKASAKQQHSVKAAVFSVLVGDNRAKLFLYIM